MYLLHKRFVRGRIGVDAERHGALLAHVGEPLVYELLGVVDVGEPLVAVVVDEVARGLRVAVELQAGLGAHAARAHARVIAQLALLQVAVLQRLLGTHSFVRIPGEQREEQLARLVVLGYLIEQYVVARLGLALRLCHVALGRLARGAHLVERGRAEHVDDLVHLLERIGGQEHDLAVEELAVDAADTPHVDGEVVVLGAEEELGRAVVLRDDLLGHVAVLVELDDSGQAEVAYLEQAVAVDEQVAGLDVAVDDARRVEVLDAAQYLVEEELDVVLGEHLRTGDDLVQVGLHELGENVDLVEEVGHGRLEHVDRVQDVVVLEHAEHLDLAEDALGRDDRLEDVGHLFERHATTRARIGHRPDDAERAVADHLVGLLGRRRSARSRRCGHAAS